MNDYIRTRGGFNLRISDSGNVIIGKNCFFIGIVVFVVTKKSKLGIIPSLGKCIDL